MKMERYGKDRMNMKLTEDEKSLCYQMEKVIKYQYKMYMSCQY